MSAEARAILARKAVTFRTAAWLLPADALDDVAEVYAFCRHVDDLADEHADRDGLLRVRAGLVTAEESPFLEVARRRRIPIAAAIDLVDGALSDLPVTDHRSDPITDHRSDPITDHRSVAVVIPDDRALIRYGYAVAGTVGRMMCPLLGAAGGETAAVHLGVAMQLTNICRDVLEDARNGRVYLPADRLRAAGVDPAELLAGTADRAAVARVVRDVLELAERWYASAESGMWHLPWRPRLAVLVAARTYRAIGRKLARNGCDALAGRTVLTVPERILAAAAALLSWPFPARIAHDAALDGPLADLLAGA